MRQQFLEKGAFRLPAEVVLSNSNVAVMDWYREEHFEHLCRLLKPGPEENNKGIQTQDFATDEDVRQKIRSSTVVVGTDKKTGAVLGGWLFFRSPLARSTRPVHSGGYILVDPKYRGQEFALKLLMFMAMLAVDMGYIGMYGRVAVTARSIVPSRRGGAKFCGIIPNSLKVLDRDEWVDDIVTASDLEMFPQYDGILQVRAPLLVFRRSFRLQGNSLRNLHNFHSATVLDFQSVCVALPCSQREKHFEERIDRDLANVRFMLVVS